MDIALSGIGGSSETLGKTAEEKGESRHGLESFAALRELFGLFEHSPFDPT